MAGGDLNVKFTEGRCREFRDTVGVIDASTKYSGDMKESVMIGDREFFMTPEGAEAVKEFADHNRDIFSSERFEIRNDPKMPRLFTSKFVADFKRLVSPDFNGYEVDGESQIGYPDSK